jgi:hypothetical protein
MVPAKILELFSSIVFVFLCTHNPITNDAGGTFNFDRDEHLAQMPGVSVVGTMTNDGINDGSNSDNMGAHVHVFPSDTDGQDILNGVYTISVIMVPAKILELFSSIVFVFLCSKAHTICCN